MEDATAALQEAMIRVAVKELEQSSYSPRVGIYRKLRNFVGRLIGRAIRRPDYSYFWTTAVMADGLAECYIASREMELLASLKQYHKKSRGLLAFRHPVYVDEAMNANTILLLARVSKEKWFETAAKKFSIFLLEVHPRTISNILHYRSLRVDVVLVDTLGMICPFLCEYARAFDDERSLELAVRQVTDFLDNGMSVESGLPYHGYNAQTKNHLGGEGWGRGVGWFMLGLSSTLISIPQGSESYSRFFYEYKKVLDLLLGWQTAEGGFPAHFLDPASELDTGATAMIAYSCAKTIERNIIGREYLPLCIAAYKFVLANTAPTGRVLGCSGEAGGANLYSDKVGWYPWGQGPSIALGAVLQRLNSF